jgi:hypothetical protein
MKHPFLLAAIALSIILGLTPSVAQIPRLLSYQAILTDTLGVPKPDGLWSVTFRLYDVQSGGSALWTEGKTIQTKSGLFSTVLGDQVVIPPSLKFDKPYWLSVQIAAQPELSPRLPLTAVGYTLNSAAADTAKFALSAPLQGVIDSARVAGAAGIARDLQLPIHAYTNNPNYGLIIENDGKGDAIRAYSYDTVANYAAVYAYNNASTGSGTGVFTGSTKGLGLYAYSGGTDAIEATTSTAGKSCLYAHSSNGYGATCRSSTSFGLKVGGGDASNIDLVGDILLEGNLGEIFTFGNVLDLYSNGNVAIDLDNANGNNGYSEFEIYNAADVAVFRVDESGNTFANGTKSAMLHTDTHGDRLVYATESPEVWLEDIGDAQLQGGTATVNFEGIFSQTINTAVPYHVFVTANSSQPVWLFVAEKDHDGFTVKGVGLTGQPADCSFDYRVVAKRRGYESVRLAPIDHSVNSKTRVEASPAVTTPQVEAPIPIKDTNR